MEVGEKNRAIWRAHSHLKVLYLVSGRVLANSYMSYSGRAAICSVPVEWPAMSAWVGRTPDRARPASDWFMDCLGCPKFGPAHSRCVRCPTGHRPIYWRSDCDEKRRTRFKNDPAAERSPVGPRSKMPINPSQTNRKLIVTGVLLLHWCTIRHVFVVRLSIFVVCHLFRFLQIYTIFNQFYYFH